MKRKRLWVVIGIGCLVLVVSCTGLGLLLGDFDESTGSTSRTTSSQQPSNKLVGDFGCNWIMDSYRTMAVVGRDTAIQHVANEMNIKKNFSAFDYVAVGDAGAAIRECERMGFR